MNDQYPASWQLASLADLGMGRTQTITPSDFPTKAFEVWSVPSFPTGSPEILLGKEIGSSKQRVQRGDVLLCKINPRINRVWVVGDKQENEQIASTEWIVFRAPNLVPEYLAYAFRESSFRERLAANVSGVGGSLTRARPSEVAYLDVPIAPANEQRRIVAKLDALFEKSRSIREKLDRLPRLLANLQKSILNSAFRGDLTMEWRANNPNTEPASELLRRIRAERRAKWEADLIAKGKDPKKAKYVEPEPVDAEGLQELPEGWSWVSANQLAWEITVGHVGTMKNLYVDHGIPFLRSKNVRANRIDYNDLIAISEEAHESLSKSRLTPGDLVVVRTGAPGTAAVIPREISIANCSDLVITRLLPSVVPEYIAFFMNSPAGAEQVLSRQVGVAQQHFNVGEMKETLIPLAPLDEQKEIVKILTAATDRVALTRRASSSANMRLERQEQAILRTAFRGELVLQDPNDEPASVLLERIRAQKPESGTKRGRGRKAAA